MIGQFPLIHLLKVDLKVETARDGIAWLWNGTILCGVALYLTYLSLGLNNFGSIS